MMIPGGKKMNRFCVFSPVVCIRFVFEFRKSFEYIFFQEL